MIRIAACLSVVLLILVPAKADTMYVQGFINAPAGADTGPSTFGYDNNGYFGTNFANLGGLPFLVTWTGTDCNCYTHAVTGATLTINGVTVDIGAFNNFGNTEWLNNADGSTEIIQAQTHYIQETLPPWNWLPGSQDGLTTWAPYTSGVSATGVFYLQDSDHQYETQAFLTVTHMGADIVATPGPTVGAGLPGLLAILAILAGYLLWHAPRCTGPTQDDRCQLAGSHVDNF
jgi:hypothetical protein